MSYLEELLPEFRKGAKIRKKSWDKRAYSYFKDGRIYDHNNQVMYSFSAKALSYDGWEFYQEPEPDWDYIIKNKCLCWFWRQDVNFNLISVLREITNNLFIDTLGNCWENCRPVRKDEVTFYEDKEK